MLAAAGERRVLCHESDLRLRGPHNLGNAAAAAAAAVTLGVPPAAIAAGLNAFAGLPHRLEWIAARGGVDYVNDSKATTPFSTRCALQAFEQPVLLLAGGYDKGTPFDDLARAAQARVRVALLYGDTAAKLADALQRVSAPPEVVRLSDPRRRPAARRRPRTTRRGGPPLPRLRQLRPIPPLRSARRPFPRPGGSIALGRRSSFAKLELTRFRGQLIIWHSGSLLVSSGVKERPDRDMRTCTRG